MLSPFPLAFIFLQRGKQPALVMMALIFGVIWFLVGQNQALLFMAEYAVMAIILGEMIRARFPEDWKYTSKMCFSSTSKKDFMVNSTQTPQYGKIHMAGDDGGDFLFVRR